MTTKKFDSAFRFAINYLKARAPKDTGNLAYNAIKYKIVGDKFIVYVDEKIAPYMVFTNETWINRSGFNPNEGWWNRTCEDLINAIAIYLKGELK